MRAICFLFLLFCLISILISQTASYLHPYPFCWLLNYMGITTDRKGYSVGIAHIVLGIPSMYLLFILLKNGMAGEDVIGRFVGGPQQGAFYDFLSTWFQIGRFFFYEKDLWKVVYISTIFLILVVFLDLFARRPDTTVILRKITKRCIYGAFFLLYHWQWFDMDLFLFKLSLPVALVPLVPAAFALYIVVFRPTDMPQHRLVPNWFDWRRTAYEGHAQVEVHAQVQGHVE